MKTTSGLNIILAYDKATNKPALKIYSKRRDINIIKFVVTAHNASLKIKAGLRGLTNG